MPWDQAAPGQREATHADGRERPDRAAIPVRDLRVGAAGGHSLRGLRSPPHGRVVPARDHPRLPGPALAEDEPRHRHAARRPRGEAAAAAQPPVALAQVEAADPRLSPHRHGARAAQLREAGADSSAIWCSPWRRRSGPRTGSGSSRSRSPASPGSTARPSRRGSRGSSHPALRLVRAAALGEGVVPDQPLDLGRVRELRAGAVRGGRARDRAVRAEPPRRLQPAPAGLPGRCPARARRSPSERACVAGAKRVPSSRRREASSPCPDCPLC